MRAWTKLFSSKQVDFSAKVRWRMSRDRNPLLVTLQDKYAVRAFAGSKGVQTPKLLHVTDHVESIPWDDLPPRCMIKASHGWNWNILRYDAAYYLFGDGKELVNADGSFLNACAARERELTLAGVVEQCRELLASKHPNKIEWAYQQITPRLLVEEYLETGNRTPLLDYRLYTFQGEVKAVNVGSALFRKRGENVFFDPAWNEIPLTVYKEKRPDLLPERPAHLQEMLRIARTLGEGIDFVRIDLYETSQGIVLGEMTVYPEAGLPDTPTACPVFNKWLGDQWKRSRIDTLKALFST